MPEATGLTTQDRIKVAILEIRGHRVLLDEQLALLYGVPTKALVQAVKRNRRRFPIDFMFRLSGKEAEILRSQSVTSRSWGGRRVQPYAFTEQGVAMLSSVLKSDRAVRVNVEIMRAFVRLRRFLVSQEDLVRKVDELEGRYDEQFKVVFDALRRLMEVDESPPGRIGFHAERAEVPVPGVSGPSIPGSGGPPDV